MENNQMGSAGQGTRSSPGKVWGPPVGMAALILLFSSTPGTYYPEHPDFMNNIVHLLEFGLLGFLLARALYHRLCNTRMGLFLCTTTICVSFGLLDEAHQFLVPERVFDLTDLLFDTVGTVAGAGSYILFRTMKTDSSGTGTGTTSNIDD